MLDVKLQIITLPFDVTLYMYRSPKQVHDFNQVDC